MKYCLKLNADNRIEYATREEFASPDLVTVDSLPDGNLVDFRYVEGEYIHDPLPMPEADSEASADDVLNALLGVTE